MPSPGWWFPVLDEQWSRVTLWDLKFKWKNISDNERGWLPLVSMALNWLPRGTHSKSAVLNSQPKKNFSVTVRLYSVNMDKVPPFSVIEGVLMFCWTWWLARSPSLYTILNSWRSSLFCIMLALRSPRDNRQRSVERTEQKVRKMNHCTTITQTFSATVVSSGMKPRWSAQPIPLFN